MEQIAPPTAPHAHGRDTVPASAGTAGVIASGHLPLAARGGGM